MKNKSKFLLALVLLVLPISFAIAAHLSYIPRFYAAGIAGYDKKLLTKADILAPVYLAADKNLFIYAQGKHDLRNEAWQDNTWMGSLGLGYRQMVKDATVLGAYVFGDYTTSTSGHNFWMISPGIESLGRAWEFRANGYFPLNDTRWVDKGWAEEFGDFHYIELTGNQQWDRVFKYYQETGPGADAEAGRTVYKLKNILFKAYLNGYYYYMKHNDDVIGAGARLTMEPNRSLKVSLHYSYDKYEHSTFLLGAQLSFYDLFTDNRNASVDENDLQRNLFIPVERTLGTIGLGSGIPVTRSDKPEDAGRALVHDNVWFFKQGVAASNAAQGKGTYEDPFIGLTPDNFNSVNANYSNIGATIDPLPLLYFARGSYIITDFAPISSRFMLPDGWSMHGWAMYNTATIHPAMDNERPLFLGGFTLGSNTSINNLRLQNNPVMPLPEGVFLDGTNNITINNIMIGTTTGSTITDYPLGIFALNSLGGLTINNSQVYADQYGLHTINTGDFTINGISNSVFVGVNALGAYIQNTNGTVNVNNISDSNFIGKAIGCYIRNIGGYIHVQNINNSNFTGNDLEGFIADAELGVTINQISNSAFYGEVHGARINSNNGAINISNINNSHFTGVGAIGFYVAASQQVVVNHANNSSFTGNGAGGIGFFANSASSTVSLSDITNNSFYALDNVAGIGVLLIGTSVTVDGITLGGAPTVAQVNEVYNSLLDAGNSFMVPSGMHLNINGKFV